jgi:hypothetical protein
MLTSGDFLLLIILSMSLQLLDKSSQPVGYDIFVDSSLSAPWYKKLHPYIYTP